MCCTEPLSGGNVEVVVARPWDKFRPRATHGNGVRAEGEVRQDMGEDDARSIQTCEDANREPGVRGA
jgi:hypothetical protein